MKRDPSPTVFYVDMMFIYSCTLNCFSLVKASAHLLTSEQLYELNLASSKDRSSAPSSFPLLMGPFKEVTQGSQRNSFLELWTVAPICEPVHSVRL